MDQLEKARALRQQIDENNKDVKAVKQKIPEMEVMQAISDTESFELMSLLLKNQEMEAAKTNAEMAELITMILLGGM